MLRMLPKPTMTILRKPCALLLALLPLQFSWIAHAARPSSSPLSSEGFFNDGGVVQVNINSLGSPRIPDATLVLDYGIIDPINPTSERVSLPLAKTQEIAVLLRKQARLLSLQKVQILGVNSENLLEISRPQLNPIRDRAVTGASLTVDLDETGSALVARPSFGGQTYWELPARENTPGLSFVEKDLIDLLRLDDLEDSLLRIRSVSAATESFYQELALLVQKTPAIDASRLILLLDSAYFPEKSLALMKLRLRELKETPENAPLRVVLSANIEIAEKLSPLSDRAALVGLVKVSQLTFVEAVAILERTFSGSANIEACFKMALERMGGAFDALAPNEKPILFSLAARKGAYEFAGALGKNWFLNHSDKSFGTLIDLLRQLPVGQVRDELTRTAIQATGNLSVAEFAALTAPLESEAVVLEIYQNLSARLNSLNSSQVLVLISQRPSGDFRDQLLLLVVTNLVRLDASALQNLLLACSSWSCRQGLLKNSFSKIDGEKARAISEAILVLPEEAPRDDLILDAADLSTALSGRELVALLQATLAEATAKNLFDRGLAKTVLSTVAEALSLSDGLYKPGFNINLFRDKLLVRAAETSTDLSNANVTELISRASSDEIRQEIEKIAKTRLGN